MSHGHSDTHDCWDCKIEEAKNNYETNKVAKKYNDMADTLEMKPPFVKEEYLFGLEQEVSKLLNKKFEFVGPTIFNPFNFVPCVRMKIDGEYIAPRYGVENPSYRPTAETVVQVLQERLASNSSEDIIL